jgi:hypothetical protein
MPTPSWLVTVKCTTGGLLTPAPVIVMLSALALLSAAVPPAETSGPLAVPPELAPPPPPPPHPAIKTANNPAPTRLIQCNGDRILLMTTPLFSDGPTPPAESRRRRFRSARSALQRGSSASRASSRFERSFEPFFKCSV